ncbi:hypothetical protein C0989_000380, partial [Termitomyces sp. Mn162]
MEIGSEGEDSESSLVLLVDKALYGTMDMAKNWWCALDEDMARLGYRQSKADQSVRTRDRGGKKTVTGTYTDDTSGMSSSRKEAEIAWRELGKKFQ